jgi:HEPN domain-containing protein
MSNKRKISLVLDKNQLNAPYVASFHGVKPTEKTEFSVYASSDKINKHRKILIGENSTIRFEGENLDSKNEICKYIVGVYNKDDNTVVLRNAPFYNVTRKVKSIESLKLPKFKLEKSLAARNELGQTFGTKKIKQKIRNIERNRVKVESLSDVVSHIHNTIEEKSSIIPSKDELEKAQEEDRLIPPYNAETLNIEEIYNIEDIVPSYELKTIAVDELIKFKTQKDIENYLSPLRVKTDSLLYTSIDSCLKQEKKDLTQLRKLLYVAYLLRLRTCREHQLNKSSFMKKTFVGSSIAIVDGLLNRYCDNQGTTSNGRTTYKIPDKEQDRILSYAVILLLMVSNFKINVTLLSKDIKISVGKLTTICSSVGCSIETLTKAQKIELGLTDNAIHKYAILKAPLKLPRLKRRM